MSRRGDRTEKRIVETAARLLRQRGAAIGMEEVARAAGVSRQALYLHFKSRTALMLAILDHVDEEADARQLFGEAQRAPDSLKLLEQVIRAAVAFHGRIADVVNALDVARHVDAAAAVAWNQRAEVRRRGIHAVVTRLRREGRLKPGWTVAQVTDALLTLVLTPRAWLDLVNGRRWSEEELARTSLALARTFVRAR